MKVVRCIWWITVLILVGIFVILAYRLHWLWTGFDAETTEPKQYVKTLWDWLQLVVVPLGLALIAFFFQRATTRSEQESTQRRYENDQRIALQRYEQDHQIALDKQHEDLLQTYLDRMAELLIEKNLRTSPTEEVCNVARVRTITVLTQLDARRVGYVFAFLREAGLMSTQSKSDIVNLEGADFHGVQWSQADISNANLSGTNLSEADLSGADFRFTNFTNANLSLANLTEVNLDGADLSNTELIGANLSRAYLMRTRFTSAELVGANLSEAYLSLTDFRDADLMGANLSGATLNKAKFDRACITKEQLVQAKLETFP